MDIPILKLIAGKKLDSAGLFHNIQIIIIQMRQKISQRQTVTVKTPCPHEPSSLWEILLGWCGSSWDRSLSMNIHVPSDRNLSTTASLAFGVEWIPTGLFLGPSLLIAVVVSSVISSMTKKTFLPLSITMGFRWHGNPSHEFLFSEDCAGIQ